MTSPLHGEDPVRPIDLLGIWAPFVPCAGGSPHVDANGLRPGERSRIYGQGNLLSTRARHVSWYTHRFL